MVLLFTHFPENENHKIKHSLNCDGWSFSICSFGHETECKEAS